MFDVLGAYWPYLLADVVIAYLLGSFNFAILVTRWVARRDIRDVGSGNAGMTNVLRSQGVKAAVWTTLGDLGKGVLAVLLGGWLLTQAGAGVLTTEKLRVVGRYIAGLFCMIGHMFPVYFGFRGGKGVLVTLATLLVVDWPSALIGLGLFIIVVLISRMVSLGSILAVISVVITTFVFDNYVRGWSRGEVLFCTVVTALLAAIIIFMHRGNIRRILNGTERKISAKKADDKTETEE